MERFLVTVCDSEGVVDRFATVEEARAEYPGPEFRIVVESADVYDAAEAQWANA